MSDMQQLERSGDGLLVRAPAKINLSLLIAWSALCLKF